VFAQTVGHRHAEKILPLGRKLKPDEALKIGLIDAIVESPDELITLAARFLEQSSRVNQFARFQTLQFARAAFTKRMKESESIDMGHSRQIVGSPDFQKTLKKVMKSLGGKKESKSKL
jgi:Delta3-Delta2-enoyl-CoA isomerase